MKCPYCGKESTGTVNFCIYCGKTVKQESSAKKIQTTNNSGIQANSSQVNKHQTGGVGNTTQRQNAKEPKEKQKYGFMAIVAFVVVGVIIVAVVVLKKQPTSKIADADYSKSYQSQTDYEMDQNAERDEYYNDNSQELIENNNNDFDTDEKNSSYNDDSLIELSEINVEDEVSSIRDKYDSIMEGVTSYYSGNSLEAIFVDTGYSGNDYSRRYYFDNDRLIFAYFEGSDSHRLYFKDNKLFRWRYASEATDPQNAVNHDMDGTDGYQQIEEYARNEGYRLLDEAQSKELSPAENISDYILPKSDTTFLTVDDLRGLSKDECRIARNELYARHGRKFDDEYLAQYFSQFEWYHPTIEPADFEESLLNDYEIANRDLIVQYEKDQGYR